MHNDLMRSHEMADSLRISDDNGKKSQIKQFLENRSSHLINEPPAHEIVLFVT